MKIANLIFGVLISLKMVSGSYFTQNLKFCVFAGDFEISTLIGDIKIRSKEMMFSVVVNFEALNNFLPTVRSGTTIVTSRQIKTSNDVSKRSDLLWVTISDFKNISSDAWNSNFSSFPLSYLRYGKSFCKPSITIGVIAVDGICDDILSKALPGKTNCYQYQLMEMLAQRFNFTMKTVELEDKRYPFVFPNGSHSGLFKIISDKNADVSCGSFFVTGKRLEKYSFLWPTFSLESKIYIKREEKYDPWTNFLKPFEKDVWAAIIVYLGLSALVRYFLYRFLHILKEVGLYRCFLLSLQAFCNQGSQDVPNHFSIRLIHLLGLLVIVILYPVFSGSIVSFLTVKVPLLPFHDFEGFMANHKYTLLTSEQSFMTSYFYFESNKDFIGKRKNLLVGLNNLAKNAKEGLKTICDGENLAYADSELTLTPLIVQSKCKVIEVPNPVLVQYVGVIVDENLPCRDLLASGLLYLRSIGIIERMQANMIPAHLTFSKLLHRSIESEIRPISITDTYPFLVLHLLGLTAATIIFFLEKLIQKRFRKRE